MQRTAIAILLLAACSGSSSSAPVRDHRGEQAAAPAAKRRHQHVTLPPVGGIDEREPVAACPRESDLVPVLRERWQVAADAAIDVVSCARGRFGEPGWLIDAFIDTSDEDSEERVEILAVGGGRSLAAREPAGSFADRYRHETGPENAWEVVDLDADGVDELLLFQEWDQGGERSATLSVFRLDGERIVAAGSLVLARDNREAARSAAHRIRCSSQHGVSDGPNGTRLVLVDGRIEEAGRRSPKPLPCPQPGAHRYGLVGGALAEVKP